MTAPQVPALRLAAVACSTAAGDPDGVHLSVARWEERLEGWTTGAALCGQVADQGALPGGSEVTCSGCEGSRDTYERALTGRPTAEQERITRLERRLATRQERHRKDRQRSAALQHLFMKQSTTLWLGVRAQCEALTVAPGAATGGERAAGMREAATRIAAWVEGWRKAGWERQDADEADAATLGARPVTTTFPVTTEYRVPCPGHPHGDFAALILRRRPDRPGDDAWAIVNPSWPTGGENAWTGAGWAHIGDTGPDAAYRWTEAEALALAPALAEDESTRMNTVLNRARAHRGGTA